VYEEADPAELDAIVKRALDGKNLSQLEIDKYKTALLTALGRKYSEKGWVMQLHVKAMRNNNTRMFKSIGPDTGYDAMSDVPVGKQLSRTMDALEKDGKLPKTILYSLNPTDDDMLVSLLGTFQSGVKGKMQLGSAWWFNDTKTGMQKQMTALANIGRLSRFVGMLTDSRSFLSYTRHEYFRRVMINLLAQWVEDGEFPADMELLTRIVRNISYYNAREYFNLGS
jgi:glucuronate isomerase